MTEKSEPIAWLIMLGAKVNQMGGYIAYVFDFRDDSEPLEVHYNHAKKLTDEYGEWEIYDYREDPARIAFATEEACRNELLTRLVRYRSEDANA